MTRLFVQINAVRLNDLEYSSKFVPFFRAVRQGPHNTIHKTSCIPCVKAVKLIYIFFVKAVNSDLDMRILSTSVYAEVRGKVIITPSV